jgi:hypothetical protein
VRRIIRTNATRSVGREELGDDGQNEIKGVAPKKSSSNAISSFGNFHWLSGATRRAMVIDSGRESVAYHVQAPNEEQPKGRQLPVTLLSGFLVSLFFMKPCRGSVVDAQIG